MRRMRLAVSLFVALFLPLAGRAQGPTVPLPEFPSAQAALRHCPGDMVVWLNLASGVYHFRGERRYAHTENGAYVCKGEADRFGTRPPRNGQ